jgi:ATP diphosphatase
MDGITKGLPQLIRAQKIQKRAAKVGFDWNDPFGVMIKVNEELNELEIALAEDDAQHIEDELGDLLFSMVNLARHLNIDPEHALKRCNDRFINRFHQMESAASASGKNVQNLDLDELNLLWEMVKEAQKK